MQNYLESLANEFLSEWVNDDERLRYKIDTVAISHLSRELVSVSFSAFHSLSDLANFGSPTLRFYPIGCVDRRARLGINLWFLGVLSASTPPFYERVQKFSNTETFAQRLEDEYDITCTPYSPPSVSDMTKVFVAVDNWLPR
jgi:hypothetical protein